MLLLAFKDTTLKNMIALLHKVLPRRQTSHTAVIGMKQFLLFEVIIDVELLRSIKQTSALGMISLCCRSLILSMHLTQIMAVRNIP